MERRRRRGRWDRMGRTAGLAMVAVAIFLSACNPGAENARRLASACSGDTAAACDTLGQQVSRGDHVLRDWRRAGSLYQQACDGQVGDGCVRLARLHLDSRGAEHGVPLDSLKASGLLERGCRLGATQGCVGLGDMYAEKDSVVEGEKAKGPLQDLGRAVALYREACDGSDMEGCDRLARAYRDGMGLTPDSARATELYRQACDGSYQVGCAHLGEAYLAGSGVEADPTRAVGLFEKACETEMVGCFDLAGAVEAGTGVAQDYERAVKLYEKACSGTLTPAGGSAPVAESCFHLGNMYAEGIGVDRNLGRASRFLSRACNLGYAEACRRRS